MRSIPTFLPSRILPLLLAASPGIGCMSGAVHTTLGSSDERPVEPRPEEHIPKPDSAGPGSDDTFEPADTTVADAGEPEAVGDGIDGEPLPEAGPDGSPGSGPGPADGNSPGPGDANMPGNPNGVAGEGGTPSEPNDATGAGGTPSEPNGPTGEGGTPSEPNTVPTPEPPLSPREMCHQAWIAEGHAARYGDPFKMAAAEDPNWEVTFEVEGVSVEARPTQVLDITIAGATQSQNVTCAVPTAWGVEVLTPGVAFDPFLQGYQRREPVRRQLATGGVAMEEKSYSAWQDISDRTLWLAWNLRPYAPSIQQLQAMVQALHPPIEQEAQWYNAVDTADDKVAPGLAVSVGTDADPVQARFWGVLSDPARAGVSARKAARAFLAVAAPAMSNSFFGAIAMANVWTWDQLMTWDTSTQSGMVCDPDAAAFELQCNQVFPAWAARQYRATLEQNLPLYVHLLWETRAGERAFLTTVKIGPDGTLVVQRTRRFESIEGLGLPSLDALHALEND